MDNIQYLCYCILLHQEDVTPSTFNHLQQRLIQFTFFPTLLGLEERALKIEDRNLYCNNHSERGVVWLPTSIEGNSE